MAIDEELLTATRRAEERMIEAERALDLARAEFRYAVRKLHLAGGSLREIGEALNLSHQRIHQIVEEAGGGGWRGFVPGRFRREGAGQFLSCSFCGKPREKARKLIAGPGGVAICGACVMKVAAALAAGEVAATAASSVKPVPADVATASCSFCGKRRPQVDGLAAAAGTTAAGVAICSECVALCQEIMAEEPV